MKVLKRDIVIPRGTVFDVAPSATQRIGGGHISKVIGLTDNSSGSIEYFFDEDDFELQEWFEEIDG
jgi:hypothetical protein